MWITRLGSGQKQTRLGTGEGGKTAPFVRLGKWRVEAKGTLSIRLPRAYQTAPGVQGEKRPCTPETARYGQARRTERVPQVSPDLRYNRKAQTKHYKGIVPLLFVRCLSRV